MDFSLVSLDESFKASAYLQEVLDDPTIADSGDPTKAALYKALNTNLSSFEWLELPENAHRLRRFGLAMRGVNELSKAAVAQG